MSEDIDRLLKTESSRHDQDQEVTRVLDAFLPDAYTLLQLQPGCTDADIKAQYRKRSLLVHPDRNPNPLAPSAFDKLKKAQDILLDEKKRESLDNAYVDARRLLIRERKWNLNDERLKSTEFLEDWREKTRDVLVENELRKRRIQKAKLEEEGRQRRLKEEELEEKKRKRDEEKGWEEKRDQRIDNWQQYKRKKEMKSKKKKKEDVLA